MGAGISFDIGRPWEAWTPRQRSTFMGSLGRRQRRVFIKVMNCLRTRRDRRVFMRMVGLAYNRRGRLRRFANPVNWQVTDTTGLVLVTPANLETVEREDGTPQVPLIEGEWWTVNAPRHVRRLASILQQMKEDGMVHGDLGNAVYYNPEDGKLYVDMDAKLPNATAADDARWFVETVDFMLGQAVVADARNDIYNSFVDFEEGREEEEMAYNALKDEFQDAVDPDLVGGPQPGVEYEVDYMALAADPMMAMPQ